MEEIEQLIKICKKFFNYQVNVKKSLMKISLLLINKKKLKKNLLWITLIKPILYQNLLLWPGMKLIN